MSDIESRNAARRAAPVGRVDATVPGLAGTLNQLTVTEICQIGTRLLGVNMAFDGDLMRFARAIEARCREIPVCAGIEISPETSDQPHSPVPRMGGHGEANERAAHPSPTAEKK